MQVRMIFSHKLAGEFYGAETLDLREELSSLYTPRQEGDRRYLYPQHFIHHRLCFGSPVKDETPDPVPYHVTIFKRTKIPLHVDITNHLVS